MKNISLVLFLIFSWKFLCEADHHHNKCQPPSTTLCPFRDCRGSPFMIWNQQTCSCECNLALIDCFAPSTVNPRTCRCEPIEPCEPQDCERPLRIWNQESCSCECNLALIDCFINSRVNPITCECEPTDPLVWQCPEVDCGDNENFFFDDLSCSCECDTSKIECNLYSRINGERCECESSTFCHPRSCGIDTLKRWSMDTCRCECDLSRISCPSPSRVDPETCECLEPCPPQNCGINPKFQWNPETCQCECPPENCGINPVIVWNKLTCQCDCPPRNCGINPIFIWNRGTCHCECDPSKIVCTADSYLDPKTCSCVKLTPPCPPQNCGINPDYAWNPKTCNCECAKICDFPFILNKDKCQCVRIRF